MIKDVDEKIIKEIQTISLAMFRKNFFGIFHGAISVRLNDNKFVINTRNAVFDSISPKNLMLLSHKRDYSYQDASIHAPIHSFIYKEIDEAKCIAYTIPPFSVAYSINHSRIAPKDYCGYKQFKEAMVYDPKEFDTWEDRADVEICSFFKKNDVNIAVIRGYGVYVYGRDLLHLAKSVAAVENSAKILTLHNLENTILDT